jgi:hypothetical protein
MQKTGLVLDVVAVAFEREGELCVFVQSWINQTVSNWRLKVIHDGPNEKFMQIMQGFADAKPDQIEFFCTLDRHCDYGHTLRQIGIDQAQGDYLLITNADNYFIPKAAEYLGGVMGQSDVVLFDMVHSHNRPGGRDLPPYSYFETDYRRGSIDVSSAIVRTKMAKKVGFQDKSHDGDATYFEDILRSHEGISVLKLPQILFVHN